MPLVDVERALRRPGEYYFEDGLWEMVGGLWMALALAIPPVVGGWWGGFVMGFLGVTSLVLDQVVAAAKERWVFPRTGRVTYWSLKPMAPEPRLSLGLSAGAEPPPEVESRGEVVLRALKHAILPMTMVIVIPWLLHDARSAPMPSAVHLDSGAAVFHIAVGLLVGGLCLYGAWRFGQRRWLLVGPAVATSGLLVAQLASSREQALIWQVSVMAFATLASGLFAFVSYRRRTAAVSACDAR